VPGLDGRKPQKRINMKYWEIIADKLSKSGWSLGRVSAEGSKGQTIRIVDAHHNDGKRFVVRADEKLTEFIELESAIPLAVNCFDKRARFFRNSRI
jgi:hypothetical protein